MISLRARFQKSFTRHVLRPRLSPAATVQQQRWWLDKLAGLALLPWGCKTQNVDCDGVPAEWVSVGNVPNSPVLLYLHGGGYCIGSPQSHRNVVARLAKGLGCRALVPDYRLAPEHPFPAPLLDVVQVYRWLLAQGVAPQQIVLAGDSAGGGACPGVVHDVAAIGGAVAGRFVLHFAVGGSEPVVCLDRETGRH